MSYAKPYIAPFNTAAISLDKVIQSIQFELAQLPWLDYSFGRAYEFKEVDVKGALQRIPKCYTRQGEYINVMPNDFARAHSFIALKGHENWKLFNRYEGSIKEAELTIIVWGNLKRIDNTKSYIFTEILKNDIEKVIKQNEFVKEIVYCIDERAEDVFKSYNLRSESYTENDVQTEYLMYPYTGFRYDITVNYFEECGEVVLAPLGATNYEVTIPDINFFATEGQSSYQNDKMKGKKIRLFRNGNKQSDIPNADYYNNFDSVTGTVYPIPAFSGNEYVSIEIY